MSKIIGERIARRLEEMDRTAVWLSDQMGVSSTAVYTWIKTGVVSRKFVPRLAQELQMPVIELTFEDIPAAFSNEELEPSKDAIAAPLAMHLAYITSDEAILLTRYRQLATEGRQLVKMTANVAPKIDVYLTKLPPPVRE